MKKFNYITQPDNFPKIPVRFLSTIIVKKISKTNITPNQITILRGIINAVSLLLFAVGNHLSLIIAFVLFQTFELLDHVDGDLARYKDMYSKMGEFLECVIDTFGSKISNLFGLCVTIGVYRHTNDFRIFYLFIAVVLGRLLWLEFREPLFKWQEKKGKAEEKNVTAYLEQILVPEKDRLKRKLLHFVFTIYSWRNQLILWAALFCYPIEKYLQINPLFLAMALIALMNHCLWLYAFVNTGKQERGTHN